MTDKRTAILLGGGSSMPAGFSSTQCLTESVLSGVGVKRNSDGTHQLTDLHEERMPVVQLVSCVARRIHSRAKSYFDEWKESGPNYEHLCYVAKQMSDEESGEMENPAVGPFAKELRAELEPLRKAACGQYIPENMESLYQEVCNYIADVVWRHLLHCPSETAHLRSIAEACKHGTIVGIATLCHDTHVETYLGKERISLADGFCAPNEKGFRYWKKGFCSEGAIPFLKLHGSVDWWRFEVRDESTEVCIPPKCKYQQRLQSEDGADCYANPGRPELLIGTFNKLAEYSQGIFLDLHYHFRATLDEADQLLVCGYSFGDKGINTALLEWFDAKPDRRFLLIHPDTEELCGSARGAIKRRWEKDPLCPEKVSLKEATTVIRKRLEDVTAAELLTYL